MAANAGICDDILLVVLVCSFVHRPSPQLSDILKSMLFHDYHHTKNLWLTSWYWMNLICLDWFDLPLNGWHWLILWWSAYARLLSKYWWHRVNGCRWHNSTLWCGRSLITILISTLWRISIGRLAEILIPRNRLIYRCYSITVHVLIDLTWNALF